MKKLTLNLSQDNSGLDAQWQLTRKENWGTRNVGVLCKGETNDIFGTTFGNTYKLRIRQTKTLRKNTTVVLTQPYPNSHIWKWKLVNDDKIRVNPVFLRTSLDNFISQQFGDGNPVYLRIKVEKVENS